MSVILECLSAKIVLGRIPKIMVSVIRGRITINSRRVISTV